MAGLFLRRINILLVFRLLGLLVGAIVLFCVGLFLAHFAEPRANLGKEKLVVLDTRWTRTVSKSGVGLPTFSAKVLLPNGNVYELETHPNWALDNRVCAAIQLGEWSDAYHVQVVHPDSCN